MPDLGRKRTPAEDPEYRFNTWVKGYNSYQPKNKIRKDEMSDGQNVEIFINSVEKRKGCRYLGNAKDSRTRGLACYTHSDGTKKIVRFSGDSLQIYNESTGDWDDEAGKTYTSDLNTQTVQAYDDLFIFNGTDQLTKYNKDDTPNITTYAQIGLPTSFTATRGGGLSAGQYTAYFKLTHYNNVGETNGTTEFTVTYNTPRTAWNGTTEKIDLAWTVDAGIDASGGTTVYFSDTSGDETYLDTISGTTASWSFLGGEIEPDGLTEPPETNSTGGVIAYDGVFDGTRLWCFKGSTLYWTGGGTQDIDHFNSDSGGGGINVARGDGDEIMNVKVTRDGKVVVYKQFSIWLAYFDNSGLINLKVANPMIGAVGRRAVAIVDDDQVFMSRYGIFTFGNQPNFPTDIYRVKSISLPIDKDLEKVTPANYPNMVLHYDFKRRLRLAYTSGGASYNNAEFVYQGGAWIKNTGLNINCYLNMVDRISGTAIIDELNKQYTLIGLDNAGRVTQLDKGYSDMGASIDGYFDTLQDDQGAPERMKKYYDQDIEIGKLQGTLEIYQYFDSGNDAKITIDNNTSGGLGAAAVGYYSVGLEVGTLVANSGVSINKRWRLNGRKQHYIRTRFRQESATATFSIMSFSGVYRVLSRRQYESENIVETTEI